MNTLTDSDRRLLLDVANVLIPPTLEMPALRDVDVDGHWLDRACAARADLLGELHDVLERVSGSTDVPAAVLSLHSNDRHAFDVLATFIAGTYYMVPRVRELIGYPGQVRAPAPLDLAADELSDEIFEGAMNYDGSYRPAPA
jgi:hypothetical protein